MRGGHDVMGLSSLAFDQWAHGSGVSQFAVNIEVSMDKSSGVNLGTVLLVLALVLLAKDWWTQGRTVETVPYSVSVWRTHVDMPSTCWNQTAAGTHRCGNNSPI